jgi:hypothetical protein
VLGVALSRGDQAQQFVLADRVGGFHRHHLGLTARERPGLVKDDRVQPRHLFQGDGVLKQDAALAPRPLPTMIAVGVARPRASGQVMTITGIAYNSAVLTSSPTASHQITNVADPAIRATSTSQKAARSASF